MIKNIFSMLIIFLDLKRVLILYEWIHLFILLEWWVLSLSINRLRLLCNVAWALRMGIRLLKLHYIIQLTFFIIKVRIRSIHQHLIIVWRISGNYGIFLSVGILREQAPNLLSVLKRNWLIEILQTTCDRVPSLVLNHLEDWIDWLDHVDGHITYFFIIEIDVFVLLFSTTAQFLWLHLFAMAPLAVVKKLGVSMETLPTLGLSALVQLCLRMSPVVLASVATWGEGTVTKLALEWPLTRVHSLMDLEVWLIQEFFTTYVLVLTYRFEIKKLKNLVHIFTYFKKIFYMAP